MNVLILLLLALQGGTSDHHDATTAATFYLEEIRVANARENSRGIILAESRLKPGQSYGENDLKQSIHRINRLPFINHADFSLEKGSSRGRYILIIDVKDQTMLFFDAQTNFNHWDEGNNSKGGLNLGARWFFPRSSMMYVGYTPDVTWGNNDDEALDTLTVGYSHYDLFGKNILFSLDFRITEEGDEEYLALTGDQVRFSSDPLVSPHLRLAIPLQSNRWFKVSWIYGDSDSSRDVRSGDGLEQFRTISQWHDLTLTWEQNTTNDNFLPNAGSLLQVEAILSRTEDEDRRNVISPEETLTRVFDTESEGYGLNVVYEKYHPLTRRQTLSYHADAWYFQADRERDVSSASVSDLYLLDSETEELRTQVQLNYEYALFGSRKTLKYGDLRFNTGLLWRHHDHERNYDGFVEENKGDTYIATAGLTFRGAWGLIRLNVNYYTD